MTVAVTEKEDLESQQLRLRRFRRRFAKSLVWLCVIVGFCFAVSPWVKIGFKSTDSIDGHVFLIMKGVMPGKNDLVAFWPKENRFYRHIWFVKYARGVGGDVVSVRGDSGDQFYINDEFVGQALPYSSNGLELEPGPVGVIPVNNYFVWTPAERSFDSRYRDIGWVDESAVIGTAYRIF